MNADVDPAAPAASDRPRHLLPPVLGGVIGLIAGIVIVMAVVVMAFGSALSARPVLFGSFLVTTTTSGGDVTAQTGPGAILLPVLGALVGAGVGIAVRHLRRARDLNG